MHIQLPTEPIQTHIARTLVCVYVYENVGCCVLLVHTLGAHPLSLSLSLSLMHYSSKSLIS